MEFLNPSIFYYLFLLAIPVIIHLFNFRKHRKIAFSSTHFLKELIEKTKATYQIRRWIILMMRILAVSSIILAFALPHIKNDNYKGDANKVALYIDNSFSMERSDTEQIKLITHAKKNAKHIVSKLNETQKVLILTNDFSKKYQKWYSPKDANACVDEIEISGNKPKVQTIINRHNQVVDDEEINSLYLFSDFQKEKVSLNKLIENKNRTIKIGRLQSENMHNISIDSCYFNNPVRQKNKIENLSVILTNHSAETQIVKGKLFINNQQKSIQKIEIPGQSTIHQNFHYSNPSKIDNINGLLKIDDSTMQFDNELYFSYSTKEQVQVCAIYNDSVSKQLINIFSDSLFNFQTYKIGQVKYNKFNTYDLIILDDVPDLTSSLTQQLQQFVQNNGHIFMFLSPNLNLQSYNDFLKKINADFLSTWTEKKQQVEYINYNNDLFHNVFEEKIKNINLPITNGYFKILNNKKSQKRDILNFMNKTPFLSEYKYGKGSVFLCASDLNVKHNNFSEHALFVPCLYNAAIINLKKRHLYHVMQNETIIEKHDIKKNDIIHLKQKDHFDMMPSIIHSNQKTLINFQDKIVFPGNYELIQNDTNNIPISFNYNRKESEMKFLNKNEITNLFPEENLYFLKLENNSVLKKYEENEKDKSIENFFILLAIILLIIELLLLKIWKV